MVYIKGYKYTSEEDAINACKMCNTYYGIPVTPDDITQNWAEYNVATFNNPIFYYVTFDESLIVVLGVPIEFEVTEITYN